jgi:biotin-dependent carboxylase-like uncharacterized protein
MHGLANFIAGNPSGAPAIEVAIGGVEITAHKAPVTVATAAPGFKVSRNGEPRATIGRMVLHPGDRLTVRAGTTGTWGYIAPSARLDLPEIMGSLSTHIRSGLGGFEGRMLQDSDRIRLIEVRTLGDASTADRRTQPAGPIRVVLGPQDDYFTERGVATLLGEGFTLSTQMDRMAYRLDGPRIEHAKGFNIVSDGIALGSIQVPGNGLPLILMADRQPTGGYPKIATVVRADLPRLAQRRGGDRLTFTSVTVEEATKALAAARQQLASLAKEVRPLGHRLNVDALFSSNLVDGVVSGLD